jgi:hypothetical protein
MRPLRITTAGSCRMFAAAAEPSVRQRPSHHRATLIAREGPL